MTDSLFQSAQLSLRPFEPDDVPALAAYLNHPDLTGRRYIPWTFPELAPLSQQQVQGIVQKWSQVEKGLQLAVVRRQGQELIGHGGCDWSWDPHCPSLSVVVAPAHQRQRYASRVLSLLLRYLFEYTPAHVVTCWVADWNLEGFQFAVHHGFRQAGRMRRAGIRQGKYYDLIVQDLLRSEWQQSGGGSHAP
jgi:RimJ/RimL family protein N-acetyltransferase